MAIRLNVLLYKPNTSSGRRTCAHPKNVPAETPLIMLRGLVKLIRFMDGLSGPAELDDIERLLREADVDREDMVVACKFSEVNYARNILAKSPWYQLIVICWREGQASPIHDHGESACGVRVVDGTATELRYEKVDDGSVRMRSQGEFSPGDVCVTSTDQIHVIRNEAGRDDLITLHLYSPPLEMSFFEPRD